MAVFLITFHLLYILLHFVCKFLSSHSFPSSILLFYLLPTTIHLPFVVIKRTIHFCFSLSLSWFFLLEFLFLQHSFDRFFTCRDSMDDNNNLVTNVSLQNQFESFESVGVQISSGQSYKLAAVVITIIF